MHTEVRFLLPLVIIVGPTAVGKSTLGVELAKALDGEIVSGDSVQVYRGLDIGSAKTRLPEQQGIPHHLIDRLEVDEPYSAAQFKEEALRLITEIRDRGRVPIVVGGTGLYIRSLLDPYTFLESGSPRIRRAWEEYLRKQGKRMLHQALQSRDPETAARLHPNDVQRIIRALEVYDLTGRSLSSQREFADNEYAALPDSVVYVGLTAPRDVLYQHINSRCEQMVRDGLIEETLKLLQHGYSPTLKPLKSIGYRHAIWYLRGLVTKGEMLRLMQRDTRHFAKRQLTWFKRDPRLQWYNVAEINWDTVLQALVKTCRV